MAPSLKLVSFGLARLLLGSFLVQNSWCSQRARDMESWNLDLQFGHAREHSSSPSQLGVKTLQCRLVRPRLSTDLAIVCMVPLDVEAIQLKLWVRSCSISFHKTWPSAICGGARGTCFSAASSDSSTTKAKGRAGSRKCRNSGRTLSVCSCTMWQQKMWDWKFVATKSFQHNIPTYLYTHSPEKSDFDSLHSFYVLNFGPATMPQHLLEILGVVCQGTASHSPTGGGWERTQTATKLCWMQIEFDIVSLILSMRCLDVSGIWPRHAKTRIRFFRRLSGWSTFRMSRRSGILSLCSWFFKQGDRKRNTQSWRQGQPLHRSQPLYPRIPRQCVHFFRADVIFSQLQHTSALMCPRKFDIFDVSFQDRRGQVGLVGCRFLHDNVHPCATQLNR